MEPSHAQPRNQRETGAVETARTQRPPSLPIAVRALRALAAVCALALALALCGTARAEANEGISGTCYVACVNAHIDGAEGGNVFDVSFPQYGITATGYCISGSVYGTPLPGTYPFVGEPAADGGYLVTVNCQGASMYENHYSPFGAQNVGGFKIYPTGAVEVVKRSAAPDVTEANGCYRLDGATYGVFADEACTTELLAIATDAAGRARTTATLAPGRYWVREKTAPAGFVLDERAFPVELTREHCRTGTAPVVAVEDAPLLAPADVLAAKIDRETGAAEPVGDASLAGALFAVEHYAGRFDSLAEVAAAGVRPARAWTVVTDERGRVSVGKDELFSDGGDGRGLPLGTVIVREVRPPVGYLPPEPSVFVCPVEVAPDAPGTAAFHAPVVAEQVVRGDVALFKFGVADGTDGNVPNGDAPASGYEDADAPRKPLADVAFDVVLASTGQAVARIVTDENGRASTADLHDGATDGALPYGTYEVREDPATTPPGYRAAEPFTVQVDENGRTSFYEVENHLVRASEAPASEHGAEGSALAETGDALGMTPRWTALAAAIGAALAAAAAKRGRRP
ncbi:MSCRAMM family protein [Gordonibacter massiliensis (ex Traore et al. 2017)]|uniref:SpaA-like prealbumin fold domain-containing protein n=1 Tax=Gordonibacter massiliensis (ex Traore et al. 2017) TaxID=1841863 RepID=A0A842JDB5_9ACTN|nr:hypothetical protein [Gordonibacter massiliensis (ex Traore et al. 2017)]